MSFDTALRMTEVLLALALIQSSLEHLRGPRLLQGLCIVRLAFCGLLLCGIQTGMASIGLAGVSLILLHRFNGPYNGGSDRMGLLVTIMLALSLNLPREDWRELAFAYLALQLVLSYFVSGWVKFKNPEWRIGRALSDVFLFSAYPVSESIRDLANRPNLLLIGSWVVISFELLFPISLISPVTLTISLIAAASFHLANACLFGLNRFLWIWLAAFPSLIWFQDRILGGL